MVHLLYRSILFTLMVFTLLIIGVSSAKRFDKNTSTATTTTTTTTLPPSPLLDTILYAPDRGCPEGQRKDVRGRCRRVV